MLVAHTGTRCTAVVVQYAVMPSAQSNSTNSAEGLSHTEVSLTKGPSALASVSEKLTLKGVRGQQCAQAVRFRCPLFPGHSRELQDIGWVLTSVSISHGTPHQLSLGEAVPAGTSVQTGRWKSDELHPLRNTWDLKYFKFSWECPDFLPETTHCSFRNILCTHPLVFSLQCTLSEAKDLYLIWLTLLSNSLSIFKKSYHWPLSYLQVALHIPSWSFSKKQTRGKDSLLHTTLRQKDPKHLSRQRGDMDGNNLPAWEVFLLAFDS